MKRQLCIRHAIVKRFRLIYYLIRYLGIRWCLFRIWYKLKLKSGWFQWRSPVKTWAQVDLVGKLQDPGLANAEDYLDYRLSGEAPRFFFSSQAREKYQPLFAQWDREVSPVNEADAILDGGFRFYSKTEKQAGFPPDWHRNHFTGEVAPKGRHWSKLGDFDFGDIKNIWELSRLGWAYTLVRAYWRTGEEKYPEGFWKLFENWMVNNPPNQGVNWKCGQEVSFRVMACCFSLYGFLDSPATTAERLHAMLKVISESGDRIFANISYAVSQKNNHGISEGVGLWTIGILFPELNKAAAWRDRGRKVLEEQAEELIYEDGAFAQHSMNYHRVMLHDCLWSIRLGELNECPLSDRLRAKVKAAADFLYQCQDERSGRLPLYGSNDGALVLPLTNCDHLDYRPVVQAGCIQASGETPFGSGPWDEESLWILNREPARMTRVTRHRAALAATAAGYYILRGEEGFLFIRCCSHFRHRPKNGDFLHVDLWWRGLNIARDPGTYSYNPEVPWKSTLGSTACHNTVTVDGYEQMDRAGRFLSVPWIRGKAELVTHESEGSSFRCFEGRHSGYERLPDPVSCRRAVAALGADTWVILDRLTGTVSHHYRLHWLLGDFPWLWDEEARALVLQTGEGRFFLTLGAVAGNEEVPVIPSVARADEDTPRGWWSPYYQTMEPAVSCSIERDSSEAAFWSVFSPAPCPVRMGRSAGTETIDVETPRARVTMKLNGNPKQRLIHSITGAKPVGIDHH